MWHENFKDFIDFEKIQTILEEQNKLWSRKWSIDYHDILDSLPQLETKYHCEKKSITIEGEKNHIVDKALRSFIPWKKGPFNVLGNEIDSEWRSDLKWDRIKDSLGDLENKNILDIGCNNGYFMFRMLEKNPNFILGIDPVVHCAAQFKLIQHFIKSPKVAFELLGVQHLKHFHSMFDTILSMGIIYHHRHPIEQLLDIKNALKQGGQAIIETIAIPGQDSICLFPEERYAKMPNVWFVPTTTALSNWLKRTKFIDIKVIDETLLTSKEQRTTRWSSNQSLDDFLDPNDKTKTIEGYPAPLRVTISARKK